jgi:hypothetical protein
VVNDTAMAGDPMCAGIRVPRAAGIRAPIDKGFVTRMRTAGLVIVRRPSTSAGHTGND